MKAALAAALAALAVLAAPLAQADNYQDMMFLKMLERHDIQARTMGIPWGHGVCADLDAGLSAVEEVGIVYRATDWDFTWDHAEWFVAIAITVYCPWNSTVEGNTYA